MYSFVKLKNKRCPNIKYPWMLECKNIKTLKEHNEKYFANEIEKGIKEHINQVGHPSSNWGSALEAKAKIKGTNIIEAGCELENQINNGKINCIIKYGCIYLNENSSYTILSDDFEIIDRINSNEMLYPSYSKEDINIKQWKGGTHWYATIGSMNVIDEKGNQKWNSYGEAEKEALKFFKKLQ